MLVDLLRRIASSDGFLSISRLAADLGSSPGSVRAMIDDLTRLGYLEAVPTECLSGGCATSCGSCAVTRSSRSWSVTPKGQRLITSKIWAPGASAN